MRCVAGEERCGLSGFRRCANREEGVECRMSALERQGHPRGHERSGMRGQLGRCDSFLSVSVPL